jgi:Ca2+-binding EF-hand superfamily protein
MQREYADFEKCFNAVSAYDRLKLGVEDFVDFIAMHTVKYSQMQLEHLFNFLDKGQKGYLKIEEFSRIYMVTNEDIDMAKVDDQD